MGASRIINNMCASRIVNNMGASRIVILLALYLLTPVNGYEHYTRMIPNGQLVPNVCTEGVHDAWSAVGHMKPDGPDGWGPALLQFGKGFQVCLTNGLYEDFWLCLCHMDSDGDGRSNGEELGDLYCEWKIGSLPTQDSLCQLCGFPITHPGIQDTPAGNLFLTSDPLCDGQQ